MGNFTFKIKSYFSGSNNGTSLTHNYSSNYSSSLYVLHKISFAAKNINVLHKRKCVVTPTNNILHFDASVLDYMSASMTHSPSKCGKAMLLPTYSITGNVKQTTAYI
jgi:hypothetical protein